MAHYNLININFVTVSLKAPAEGSSSRRTNTIKDPEPKLISNIKLPPNCFITAQHISILPYLVPIYVYINLYSNINE